jgi:sulfite exporter TauE/SafE
MTLLLAILGASLLGSVHCAAMCGGFVCMYSGSGLPRAGTSAPNRRADALAPHVAYNAGRLASYLILGALAGSVGLGIDRLGSMTGVGRLAAIVAGALMVLWGGSTLLAASGIRIRRIGPSRAVQATLTSLLVRARGRSPTFRGAATGLLTTLLPCGWLYAFVATAAGTGRVRDALAVMVFFWLGTLPMMMAIGLGAQRVFGSFQRRLPLVSAGLVVALGVLSMAGRLTVRPMSHAAHSVEAAHDGR